MTALVSGVYGYADYENMLPLLAELCGVEDTGRETLIPALIGWLYETEDVALPSRQVKAAELWGETGPGHDPAGSVQ